MSARGCQPRQGYLWHKGVGALLGPNSSVKPETPVSKFPHIWCVDLVVPICCPCVLGHCASAIWVTRCRAGPRLRRLRVGSLIRGVSAKWAGTARWQAMSTRDPGQLPGSQAPSSRGSNSAARVPNQMQRRNSGPARLSPKLWWLCCLDSCGTDQQQIGQHLCYE
jgi:hypothetical protein